jgi:succinate dehydrogenase/fumarate reductase-like Fe-S protein
MKEIHVTIRRSGPEESYLQQYTVPVAEGEILSVLNVLEYIYRELDPTLAFFDHAACRQAACGKCMVKLDGAVKLACKEIAHDGMLLEPYSARVVRDLLCES